MKGSLQSQFIIEDEELFIMSTAVLIEFLNIINYLGGEQISRF